MSRMQNILDKAERDGSIRMRIMTENIPVPAAPGASAAAPVAPVAPIAPVVPLAPIAPGSVLGGPDSPAVAGGRRATGARLDPRLVSVSAPNSTAAEQYRALRTRLSRADQVGPASVILVTSPGRGEGKTLTAANLALAMAQEYLRRVCIVDANLRDPRLHKLFDLNDSPGLSDVLEGSADLDQALVTLEDHALAVVPAGRIPSHPAELLGTTTMRRLLQTLRTSYDCVIVDAPGAAPLADVGVLAPIVDGVLVVVRAGKTAKPAIQDTIAGLDGRVLGVVLNDTE